MYIQKFKLDFLRNYCVDLNQTLYESLHVQGNKILMTLCWSPDKDGRHALYGKNLSKLYFSETGWPISTKLGMLHWGLQPIIVCSNYDFGVTMTYFTAWSNLVTLAFLKEKVKTVDMSETISASYLKGSRSRHLIEYLKL